MSDIDPSQQPQDADSAETAELTASMYNMYLYAFAGPQASYRSVAAVINGVKISEDGCTVFFNDSDGNPAQAEVSADTATYLDSRYRAALAHIEWSQLSLPQKLARLLFRPR